MGLGRIVNGIGGALSRNAQGIASAAALVSLLVPGGAGLAAGLAALSGALDGTFQDIYRNQDGTAKTVGGVRVDTILLAVSGVLVLMVILALFRYLTAKR